MTPLHSERPRGAGFIERFSRARLERAREREEIDWLKTIAMPKSCRAKNLLSALSRGGREEAKALAALRRFCSLDPRLREPLHEHWDAAVSDRPRDFASLSPAALEALGAAGLEWGKAKGSQTIVVKALRAAIDSVDHLAFEAIAGHWGADQLAEAPLLRLIEGVDLQRWPTLGRALPQAFLGDKKPALGWLADSINLSRLLGELSAGEKKHETEQAQKQSDEKRAAEWEEPGRSACVRQAWTAAWLDGGQSNGLWAWGRWALRRSRAEAWPMWVESACEAGAGSQEIVFGPSAGEEIAREMLQDALLAQDAEAMAQLARVGLGPRIVDSAERLRARGGAHAPFMVFMDEFGYYSSKGMAAFAGRWTSLRRLAQREPADAISQRGSKKTPLLLPAPAWRPKINHLARQKQALLAAEKARAAAQEAGEARLASVAQGSGEWASLAQKSLLSKEAGLAGLAKSRRARSL